MENKIGIYVFSRDTIKDFVTDLPHIFISIREPDTKGYINKPLEIPYNQNLVARLDLDFCDMDCRKSKPEHLTDLGYKLFSVEDAKSIIKFINLTKNYIKLIIVQCPGGISRSYGVAAALSKLMYDEDQLFFDKGHPNMYVYRTILNVAQDMKPIGEENEAEIIKS